MNYAVTQLSMHSSAQLDHQAIPVAVPQEQRGGIGIVAELAAQVSNVNIDEVLVANPVRSPDVVNELAPGERHRRTARQSHEQVTVRWG